MLQKILILLDKLFCSQLNVFIKEVNLESFNSISPKSNQSQSVILISKCKELPVDVSEDIKINKWEEVSEGSESNIVGKVVVIVGVESLEMHLRLTKSNLEIYQVQTQSAKLVVVF